MHWTHLDGTDRDAAKVYSPNPGMECSIALLGHCIVRDCDKGLPHGSPGLYLKDSNGVKRAALFHADDATGPYIMDADGVTRIGIAQFAHGGGGVALHGPESKGAAVLYLKDEGSLRFFDSEGVVTHQVVAQKPEAKD